MRIAASALLIAALAGGNALAQSSAKSQFPWDNPALSPQQRAADLVSQMTLQEKAEQSINDAPAIPRLGVPAYNWWNEGLHGSARSGYSTLFPQAIGNAATFDAPLLYDIGTVISTEARAKYNQAIREGIHSIYFGLTIWSPNINIFRDPRWGRGQETYGEDPFLTGTLGENFIRGVQGNNPKYFRAIATPKHYAVHSGPESLRHKFNVDPSPHDLWDTYLPQFRAAIVDGHADSIMCAYNALYGIPDCASPLLVQQILRKDWGFKGFITSDCDAIADFVGTSAHNYAPDAAHAAAIGIKNGIDTDCGEVTPGNTYLALPQAVHEGLLQQSDIDRTLTRLFEARIRLGLFDPPSDDPYAAIPYSAIDALAHQALALRAARESIVLLKNANHILPLSPSIGSIAVVGPNASSLAAIEGNYNAIAKNPEMPIDGIEHEFSHAHIFYAQGAPYADGLPVPIPRTQFRPAMGSHQQGLKAEFFSNDNFSGAPVLTRVDSQIDFDWNAAAPIPQVTRKTYSVRWTGTISVPAPGDYPLSISFAHCHPCMDVESFTVKVDGKTLDHYSTDKPETDHISRAPSFTLHLDDTAPHTFELDYAHNAPLFGGGVTLGWIPPAAPLLEQAKAAAAKADVIVAFVGLSPDLEGEEMPIHTGEFSGGDRTDIKLPSTQRALLAAMSATGKPLVIVSMSGSAIAYTGAKEHNDALLQAWYPGQGGAQAIAETLSGKNDPSGRLPVTFYAGLNQLPPFTDYSMKDRTYRYFTGQPLWEFGYGLSYTHFTFANLQLSTTTLQAGQPLEASARITNDGHMAGDEVAELYLIPPANGNGGLSPKLQLEGFTRVHLAPGESTEVHFTLSPRQLSEVDAGGNRSVQPGDYKISVGGDEPNDPQSPTPAQTAAFTINGSVPLPH